MSTVASTLLTLLLLVASQFQRGLPDWPTSKVIDYARMIARDEGYDVTKTGVYTFDLVTGSGGQPFCPGYTAIDFRMSEYAGNLFVINNRTAQAIDFNTCEVFDYPDLKPWQDQTISLTKAKRETPQELADDVGCGSPKVLNKPATHVK